MRNAAFYTLLFIPVLIMVRPYSFEAFGFFHGTLESIAITVGFAFLIELAAQRLHLFEKTTIKQFKWVVFSCFLLCGTLWAYLLGNLTIHADGRAESFVLLSFSHVRSWAGNEHLAMLSPVVGVIGLFLTLLALFAIRSLAHLQLGIQAKALTFLPLVLYYMLIYFRMEHISTPVFHG